jgi:hypothetical protein
MIVRKVSIGLLIMVLVACARTKDSQTQTTDLTTSHLRLQDTARIDINQLYLLESYLYDQPLDTAQVIEVDFDCAILVFPSDEQIQQMKIEYGEQDFYIIADDNNWYQGTSIGLLDSANVMKVTPKKQFVRLVGNEGTWTINLRRTGALAWNLIFFNQEKKPEIISTVDLTIEKIRTYFDK